jgi:hypothetical protein
MRRVKLREIERDGSRLERLRTGLVFFRIKCGGFVGLDAGCCHTSLNKLNGSPDFMRESGNQGIAAEFL